MSVPLRQLADKYKPDLHISKLICIAPETVCRKRMQLGWSWQDLCMGKKKKMKPSNTYKRQFWHEQPSEDSSHQATAVAREAESWCPSKIQQRGDAHKPPWALLLPDFDLCSSWMLHEGLQNIALHSSDILLFEIGGLAFQDHVQAQQSPQQTDHQTPPRWGVPSHFCLTRLHRQGAKTCMAVCPQ